jgi:hypothetical protein
MNFKFIENYKNYFSIVVVTSDNYSSLLDGFFHYLKKNWPNNPFEIFLSLESQEYKNDMNLNIVYNHTSDWSKRLHQTLKNVQTKFVILFLDDYWILKKVDQEMLTKILDYTLKNDLSYISYSRNLLNSPHKLNSVLNKDDIFFYSVDNSLDDTKYLVSAEYIYNKNMLMNLLRKNESAWEFENNASYRLSKVYNFGNHRFYARKNPLSYLDGGIIHKGEITDIAQKILLEDEFDFKWEKKTLKVSTRKTPIILRALRKMVRAPKKILSLYFFKIK